eukprot:TRINITY_DN12615_c0_g2_i1.p1 TRINITY_DN12615_c0_g2~~TRINITY_DN12615_c0_g2_i1.p1  ORF type:complete len:306 (+),score=24.90 TRINITY_DN12615_c0_g2_i1:143-1060(+)
MYWPASSDGVCPRIIPRTKHRRSRRVLFQLSLLASLVIFASHAYDKAFLGLQWKSPDPAKDSVAHLRASWKKGDRLDDFSYFLAVGVPWALAYILYIRASWLNGKYMGTPAAGLFMAIIWEFIFSLVFDNEDFATNLIWVLPDVVLIPQYVYYEVWLKAKQACILGDNTQGVVIAVWNLLLFIIVAFVSIGWIDAMHDFTGTYLSFAIVLPIELFFLQRLFFEPEHQVGDLYAVVIPGMLRLVGNFLPFYIVLGELDEFDLFLHMLWACTFVTDVAFVVFSLHLHRRQGKDIAAAAAPGGVSEIV